MLMAVYTCRDGENMSDPFDISKALEGAVKDKLSPDVARFQIHSKHDPAGDQEKAIEKLVFQLMIYIFINSIMIFSKVIPN